MDRFSGRNGIFYISLLFAVIPIVFVVYDGDFRS